MLEPTEPTQGSEHNTPSDTLPPRRRRRAASRPAGPPAVSAFDAPAGTVEPAIPAAEDEAEVKPDETVTEAPAQTEAEEAEESAEAAEAAPAGRPRRRATRRASARRSISSRPRPEDASSPGRR
ncbi:hypothetical protein, partial [Streptomyces sp. MUM 2J]|uniref:hypothetical protein n=1 Tax=Streptomyces sp. MUM 2J TaxID=2791987 RepID=UPI001F03EBE0